MDRGPAVFNGARASYVAMSCCAVLVLSMLAGAWISDSAGAVATLGLMAVYIGSSECLVLFYALAPLSALIDLFRLGGPKDLHGRGWLILFQLLGIAAKAAGAFFAWSLHQSAAAGEGPRSFGGAAPPAPAPPSGYARVDDPFAAAPVSSYSIHQPHPPLPTSSPAMQRQPPAQPQQQPAPAPVQQQQAAAPAPQQQPPQQQAVPPAPAPELL